MARWSAAFVVVLTHVRALLFVGWADLPASAKNPVVLAFYSVTVFAHEAVIVFFVLSGLLVGGINAERVEQGKFRAASFAIDRFTRIYVTFLPAVALTLVLDQLGSRWFRWSGFYNEANLLIAQRFGALDVRNELGATQILGNLFMLQPVHVPVLGINVPLWSLSYEVWFYVWFGLVAYAATKSSRAAVLVGVVGSLILALFFQWLALYYLLFWTFGIAAYRWDGWPRTVVVPLCIMAASLAWVASGRQFATIGGLAVSLSDVPLAVSTAWLLHASRAAHVPLLVRMKDFNDMASNFSYSLYAIHFPVAVFTICALARPLGLKDRLPSGLDLTDPRDILLYPAVVLVAVLVAFLYAQAVERQTDRVRRIFKRRLSVS